MKWIIVINGKAPARWGALNESLLDAVFHFPAKMIRALVEADYLIQASFRLQEFQDTGLIA